MLYNTLFTLCYITHCLRTTDLLATKPPLSSLLLLWFSLLQRLLQKKQLLLLGASRAANHPCCLLMNYNFVSGKKNLFYRGFKEYKSKYFITYFILRNKTEWFKNTDNKLKINLVLFYENFSCLGKRTKIPLNLKLTD